MRVFTTARKIKHPQLVRLGAELVIDYTATEFETAAREATGGRGVDVILDIQGASYLARNIDALTTGGRLIIIGMQAGRRAEIDLGQLMAKRATVTATALRARPRAEKAAIVQRVREQVWPLIERGEIRPVIDQRLPMQGAARAHEIMARNEHIGKVLLLAPVAADQPHTGPTHTGSA
jgi:NADPH:quinone reductase-like Zn-dependent oxidoreductase